MVEGNGLENRRASNGTEGSNPSLSAIEIPRPFGRGISIVGSRRSRTRLLRSKRGSV